MDSHVCFDVEAEALVVKGGPAQGEVSGLGPGAVGVVGLHSGDEIDDVEQGKDVPVINQAAAISVINGFTCWCYHACYCLDTMRFHSAPLSTG